MREYNVYIIREEFASIYYGLESKLFHLFIENYESKGKLKEITTLQINYISEQIDKANLDKYLTRHLLKNKGYIMDEQKHFLKEKNDRSFAQLVVENHCVKIKANGLYDAEVTFFELLRNYHSYFLAMDYRSGRYGWLKPIKTLKYANHS